MPRLSVPGFVGGANVLRSPAADCEDTINWYLEGVAPGTGQKSQQYYLPTPGLRPYATVDDSPGRFAFYQDDRCFGVTGGSFWELLTNGSTIIWGSVFVNSSQVSIVSNGTAGGQLFIVTGGNGYVFDLDANTLTEVNSTNFPGTGFPEGDAQCCEFIDGYGIVTQRGTRRFFISALEDFTSWDPLDVYERSEGSDNIIAVRRNHRELWFPGSLTGEVWYDSGDALTPFQPVPGVFLDEGVANPMSFIRYRNGLATLTSGPSGGGIVSVSNGYRWDRISTHAVEQDIQQVTSLNFSWLFAQQQQGHEFLWLLLPELPWTWVYDGTTNVWHKRALWNSTECVWEPHLAQAFVYAFSGTADAVSLVLDRTSGVIYELDLDAYDDAVVV